MREIRFHTDAVQVHLIVGDDGVVRLKDLLQNGATPTKPLSQLSIDLYLPLVEVRIAGEGNEMIKTSKSLIGSKTSRRLKYQSHQESEGAGQKALDVVVCDPITNLEVTVRLSAFVGLPVIRTVATVVNRSSSDVIVSQISSAVIGGLTARAESWEQDYEVLFANNSWFREAQWTTRTLASVGIGGSGVMKLNEGHHGTLAQFSLSNTGSFSTGSFLPMGLLSRKNSASPETWLWQIETNGSWRWEIGDYHDSIYLAASGPTARNHNWRTKLASGESFTSVPVSVCHVLDGIQSAFAALTSYRRKIRRTHEDNQKLHVIFNDYMNCLMGDPTEEKVLALLEPVAKLGVEYFVIDAGWYADDSNWWDDVGEWEPSKKRFPSGFKALLDAIRAKGIVPGVWVEPEVIGVRNKLARELPEECFFHECGARVEEKGRYQLDYRHPVVRERMHEAIRKLVIDYGVGYFKFDYNIEVTQGTDTDTFSTGAGQLGHNRAYILWVNELYDRYPDLIIESCSSGAQRMDYAMLATHSLQSTSDQQDPVLYSAISAAIPTAVTPEQSGIWSYPQPEYDDELNALTLVNSMLGRMYLSGNIPGLNEHQLELIAESIRVYKSFRDELPRAQAFWPLGFPGWDDEWLSLGMVSEDGSSRYLAVWRRRGPQTYRLPILDLKGRSASAALLFPRSGSVDTKWCSDDGVLDVTLPKTMCARLFRITEA